MNDLRPSNIYIKDGYLVIEFNQITEIIGESVRCRFAGFNIKFVINNMKNKKGKYSLKDISLYLNYYLNLVNDEHKQIIYDWLKSNPNIYNLMILNKLQE